MNTTFRSIYIGDEHPYYNNLTGDYNVIDGNFHPDDVGFSPIRIISEDELYFPHDTMNWDNTREKDKSIL